MKRFKCSNCGSMDFEARIQVMTPYIDVKLRNGEVVKLDASAKKTSNVYLIDFICTSCGDCFFAGEYETIRLCQLDEGKQLTPEALHEAFVKTFETPIDEDDIIEL